MLYESKKEFVFCFVKYRLNNLLDIFCQAMPNSSILKMSVEPPGIPGCENLP